MPLEISLNKSAEKSSDSSSGQRRSSSCITWKDGDKTYRYRYTIYEATANGEKKVEYTDAEWIEIDVGMKATLEKVNGVAKDVFKPGIASFSIESKGGGVIVTYSTGDKPKDKVTLSSEKLTDEATSVANKFFAKFEGYRGFPVDELPSSTSSPVKATKKVDKRDNKRADQTNGKNSPHIATATAAMNQQRFLGKQCEDTLPINIVHQDNSCFLAALIQCLILTDPILEKALWDDRIDGPTAEIGRFLHEYRRAQLKGKKTVDGVAGIRRALWRISGNKEWMRGQQDPSEALVLIRSNLQERGKLENYGVSKWDISTIKLNDRRLLDEDEMWKLVDNKDGTYQRKEELGVDFGEVLIDMKKGMGSKSLIETLIKSLNHDEETEGKYSTKSVDSNKVETTEVKKVTKQTQWETAPARLTAIFKRNDEFKNEPVTVDEFMTLPAEAFVSGPEQKYELVALECHDGVQTTEGHHYGYVKINGKWFLVDDMNTESPIEIQGNPWDIKGESEKIYIACYKIKTG
ncbi:MAG: Ubiquitin carboxyl-terminal hydrolase [Parachlamydiales bacterium]|nr:Ubiquitin carboxyl-terminal hydrolase [Parachlamydiales bacterium]